LPFHQPGFPYGLFTVDSFLAVPYFLKSRLELDLFENSGAALAGKERGEPKLPSRWIAAPSRN
jgi:hypothetical protein